MASKSDPVSPDFHEYVLELFVDRLREVDGSDLDDMAIEFGDAVKHHNATLYPVTVAGKKFTLMLLDHEQTPAAESSDGQ